MAGRSDLRYAAIVKHKKPWEVYLKESPIVKGKSDIEGVSLNLASQFLRLRKENKLSQKEIAQIISVKQSTISRLEKSTQNISLDLLIRIAEAFKIEYVISSQSVHLMNIAGHEREQEAN